MDMQLDIEGAKRFHGHWCPGLATGVRVAEVALREIGPHSEDEEIVCIAETNNCAIDAIQFFTGCTAGKGNLVQRDYGKNVFTFLRRSDGKAVRISRKPRKPRPADPQEAEIRAKQADGQALSDEERAYLRARRQAAIQAVLDAPLDEMFDVREIQMAPPAYAEIHPSITCADCGEPTMATRIREIDGQPYCIPCAEERA